MRESTQLQFDERLHAYLRWQRDRGQVWPIISTKPQIALDQADSQPVCDQCRGTFTDLIPHYVGDQPRVLLFGDSEKNNGLADHDPYSGKAGELLSKMLIAIKVDPKEALLCNVIDKTHPHCEYCWRHVVELANPACVIFLGEAATQALLGDRIVNEPWQGSQSITRLAWSTPTIAIHHPRDLIRTPILKREAWKHLQLALRLLSTSQ